MFVAFDAATERREGPRGSIYHISGLMNTAGNDLRVEPTTIQKSPSLSNGDDRILGGLRQFSRLVYEIRKSYTLQIGLYDLEPVMTLLLKGDLRRSIKVQSSARMRRSS